VTRPTPLLVVVTGAPGVGKTTVAEALAAELELPLLTKDDVKEALFDSLGTGDRAWSTCLGGASFEVLFVAARRLLAAGVSCVLEANFTDAAPFRKLPSARVVQVVCQAPPDVVLERYASRQRHPGHLDDVILDELGVRLQAGEWRPLELDGELIEMDTETGQPTVFEVAQQIRDVEGA
jgi:predicted kinase